MDFASISKNLQAEFLNKKIQAENIATQNLLFAKKNPNFVKLCNLESEIVFQIAGEKILEKPNKTKLNSLEQTLKKVKKQKGLLLKSLGLSEADLKPKFECEKCHDSGFIGGQPCDCFIKRRNEEFIKNCGLKKDEFVDFCDFDEKIFSDAAQLKKAVELKNWLKNWCENFPAVSKNFITILGETGVGKTFLSKCAAKSLLDKGLSVCFVSAFEMNNIFFKYHTTFDSTKQACLVPLLESDVLFVDDLGTEPLLNNVTKNYLFLILSERERFHKPVIITSNLKTENLRERYDDRIFSRLTNKNIAVLVELEGLDLRNSTPRKK